jgi:Antimicrobial peptide resistance and lipid A acylation protein PagP
MVADRPATQRGAAGPRGRWRSSAAVAWLIAGTMSPALAQSVDEPSGFCVRVQATTPAGVTARDSDTTGLLRQTADGIRKVWSSGRSDLLVPGYIWHMPWQYSSEQRARYNTAAWGIGYGRTMIDSAGRPRTLFGIVSADSYDRFQYMAGYAWRANWRPAGGSLKLGAGYTALVIGRSDTLSYAPVPVALPLVSIGTDRFELLGAYVPGFEVGYFFARVGVHRRQTAGSSQ